MSNTDRQGWWAYGFAALGGLLFGYDTGVIGGALVFIQRDFRLGPVLEGIVVSALLFGAAVGSAVAGRPADRLGRRRLLMGAGIVCAAGAMGSAVAPTVMSLIACRTVLGSAVGVVSVAVPLYPSETAPTRLRGAVGSLYQLLVACGVFVAYVVDYALAGSGAWRVMVGLAAAPAVLLALGMWRAQETPRWLIAHGHIEQARSALALTHVDAEVEHVIAAAASQTEHRRALWSRPVWPLVALAAALAVLQQLVGINTIVYYAPTILRAAGLATSAALLNGVGLGLLSIVMTVVAAWLVDRVGRRPLLLCGAAGMVIALTILGLLFSTGWSEQTTGRVTAVTCLAMFKASFSLSWGPLLWVILPELLPLTIRGTAMGATTFLNWVTNVAVSLVFPSLLGTDAGSAFWWFAGCAMVAFALVAIRLPETSGRSLERIELDRHHAQPDVIG